MIATYISTGSTFGDALVAVFATMTTLAGIAAASHRPPFRQIGRLIGFISRRLVGEPLLHWIEGLLDRWWATKEPQTRALIKEAAKEAADEAVEPLATNLRDHMADEGDALDTMHEWQLDHARQDTNAYHFLGIPDEVLDGTPQ